VLTSSLAVSIALMTPWGPTPDVSVAPASLSSYFTSAQIARSEAFFDAAKWPSWLGLAVGVAVPVGLGFSSLGKEVVRLVRRWSSRWWVQVIATGSVVVVVQRLVTLPFGIWTHRVATSYGLSTQSWGGYAVDAAKSLAITLAITSVGLVLVVGLARRFPRTWFAPAAASAAGLVLLLSFAYPIVLEPLFNRFTPLADGPLRSRLLMLAARDDIAVSDVLVADASRRTTALNAYVSGFGASKRIVVYDTLLDSASDDEIALVVAHELGHAARDDVLVGTVEGALGAAAGVVAVFLLVRLPRTRRATGAGSAGDPAIVPVLLALAAVAALAAAPVENTVSRRVEARADIHSLDLTGDTSTFIAVQQRLAVSNLTHLQPNPVLAFWFSSHPAPLDRIGLALQWHRRHEEPR
jgi:STE24 endopeptidase